MILAMFSACGSGHSRCVRTPVLEGIWKKANIRQLKMEVEYIEKPRGPAFPIKLVGCDNGYYVNQTAPPYCFHYGTVIEWITSYFRIKGGKMQHISTVSCQSVQEFSDFIAKEYMDQNTKIISIAPTGGIVSQTDGKVEFHEYIVIWEER